jgi:hypothetical protein
MFFTALRFAVGQRSRLRCLADEFVKGDALSNNTGDRQAESFGVIELAVIIAVRLFIQVAEQVEGLYADVGARDATLQKRPEVFQTVRVHLAIHVGSGMVDHLNVRIR